MQQSGEVPQQLQLQNSPQELQQPTEQTSTTTTTDASLPLSLPSPQIEEQHPHELSPTTPLFVNNLNTTVYTANETTATVTTVVRENSQDFNVRTQETPPPSEDEQGSHFFQKKIISTGKNTERIYFTVNVDAKGVKEVAFVFLLVVIQLSGGMLYGYNLGVISASLFPLMQDFSSIFFDPSIPEFSSSLLSGLVAISSVIGGFFGAMIGGFVTKLLGRKISIGIMSVISLIGGILCSVLPLFELIVLSRVLLGIGTGSISVTAPIYALENAPPKIMGLIGALFTLGLNTGILISYLVGLGFSYVIYTWRWMFGFSCLFSIVLFVCFIVMPESENWIATGNVVVRLLFSKRYKAYLAKQAQKAALVNESQAISPTTTTIATSQNEAIISKKEKQAATTKLVCYNIFLFGLGLVMCLGIQFTGVNAIIYFTPAILGRAGYSATVINGIIIGLGIWNVLANVVAIFFINSCGRKILLLSGNTLLIIATLLCGFAVMFASGDVLAALVIVGEAIFYLGFNFSFGGLFYVVINELAFHARWREIASSILNAIQLLENIIIGLFFLPLGNAIGQQSVFFILTFVAVLCFFAVLTFFEETRPTKKKQNKTKTVVTATTKPTPQSPTPQQVESQQQQQETQSYELKEVEPQQNNEEIHTEHQK